DRGIAGQALDHLAAGEGIADQAEPPFTVKPGPVEGYNTGGLLAPMLQRMQSQRGDGGGFGMTEDAEHAAFLPQRVPFQIAISQVDRRGEVPMALCGVLGRALQLGPRVSLFGWHPRASGLQSNF